MHSCQRVSVVIFIPFRNEIDYVQIHSKYAIGTFGSFLKI